MYVAEKDLLHEMMKVVRKKPDYRVKEKILILIDTWQEAFGGPRARYPQYFAAYQELMRKGYVFPKRSERSPVFTPPQSRPLPSYPQNPCKHESRENAAESSAEAEFPTLSLTEIQNARAIMHVLAEMLNAIDPENKEALKQDVIVDLVDQCNTYKKRVVHLVNSTADESLLSQGLTLNDDLQRVLAKHEAISSRASSVQAQKPKFEAAQMIQYVDTPLVNKGDSKQTDKGSASGTNSGTQLPLPAPLSAKNDQSTTTKTGPKIDLLSGDDLSSLPAENSLAIVPVGEPQPASPAFKQNGLALIDMSSPTSNPQSTYPGCQKYPLPQQFPLQQNRQSPESSLYPNRNASGTMSPQYEQSPYPQGSNALYPNRNASGTMSPQYEQSPYSQGSNALYPNRNASGTMSPQYEQSPYSQGSNALYPNRNASGTMSPQYEQSPYSQGSNALYPNRNASGTMSPQYEQSPYPQGSNALYPNRNASGTMSPQYEQSPYPQGSNALYPNRNASGTMSPQYERSPYPQGSNALWNGHITQQEQPASPAYGSQDNGAFPAPPWEAETIDSNSMCGSPCMFQNNQVLGGSPNSLSMQSNQFSGSPHALQMQNNQLGGSPHALQMQNNQLGVSPHAVLVLTNSQRGGSPHTLPVQNNLLGGNPHALTMQNNQLVAMNHPQFPGAVFANGSQLLGNEQVGGIYGPGGNFTVNQAIQNSQLVGLNPQHHQSMGLFSQQMPSPQMVYMYSQTYTNQLSGYGCGLGQQQNPQLLDQRMSGLNIQDDGILKGPPYLASTPSSYVHVPVPMGKSTKPEDKLFGDLVDVSKFKSSKPGPARAGSICP
ncbi:PREDICTED: uncharacterized protein LOC109174569 isoform X2 [Ipomoea nil]|nr:PREDICTED: uncharacterized protein LOC109174569 isoform X2 [Ipomoea nil]